MVARAGTLLIPSGPLDNAGMRHLHIVCTDPCVERKQLVVSITTWRNNLCDGTCILDRGDHPFVVHRSWVLYRAAKIEPSSTFTNGIERACLKSAKIWQTQCLKEYWQVYAPVHTPSGASKILWMLIYSF